VDRAESPLSDRAGGATLKRGENASPLRGDFKAVIRRSGGFRNCEVAADASSPHSKKRHLGRESSRISNFYPQSAIHNPQFK
jgi:hypothetical protein